MPIQGILIGEHALGESLTDDTHRLRVTLAVEIAEITAGDDRNTEGGKESGRDGTPMRAGIVYAGGMDVTVGGALHTRSGAAIAPGNPPPARDPVPTSHRLNPAHRF